MGSESCKIGIVIKYCSDIHDNDFSDSQDLLQQQAEMFGFQLDIMTMVEWIALNFFTHTHSALIINCITLVIP